MQQTITILQWLIFIYLLIQVAYLLFFSLAASVAKKKIFPAAKKLRTIRVFIPGYKEDAVIVETAREALRHNYPANKLEVVVIADSFSKATLKALKALPIKVLEVSFDKSTKGKALQKAVKATAKKPVDIVVILDADNHMSPGFLHAVNNAYEAGYNAIQGHRTAKNLQTSFAFLDACTEEINNHIFRRGHTAVGLPSALIGSGMAFDSKLFATLLNNIGDTAGEDKELEFRLIRSKQKVAFLDGAFVLDEKVARKEVFSKQRSRWLAMQAEYFEKYFLQGCRQLLKGNVAFFNKALQTFLLPRVMLITVILTWLVLTCLFSPQWFAAAGFLTIAFADALLLGIPARWYNKRLVSAFMQIPGALLSMIAALLQIKQARRQFIHTPHGEALSS